MGEGARPEERGLRGYAKNTMNHEWTRRMGVWMSRKIGWVKREIEGQNGRLEWPIGMGRERLITWSVFADYK
jgi:hypothetical protein